MKMLTVFQEFFLLSETYWFGTLTAKSGNLLSLHSTNFLVGFYNSRFFEENLYSWTLPDIGSNLLQSLEASFSLILLP